MPPRLSPTPAYSSNIELYGDGDSAGLTPRTPFSRQTANAEEGRARPAVAVNSSLADLAEDQDDENLDEIELMQTQSHPLLSSSTSESFPGLERSSGMRRRSGKMPLWNLLKERLLAQRIPLGLVAGCGFAILLLLLVVVSFRRPDTLRDYAGVNSTAIFFEALDEESQTRFNSTDVVDYAKSGFTSFPLTTHQYIQQCWNFTNDPRMRLWVPYWDKHAGGDPDVLHKKPSSSLKPCNSTITYLLDGSVGLMGDLAHLAQVAGFAREQNRTLFINDDSWNRGQWKDHFLPISETLPGPEPGCAPPPPDEPELVACPRTSRHWVTSARIGWFHMGQAFDETFEDPYKYNIERKKPVFDRAVESFQKIIRPSAINEHFIKTARGEVRDLILSNSSGSDLGYIAAHIRRGDRKAQSWRYHFMQNEQVPTSDYVDAVWKAYLHFQNLTGGDDLPPVVYLASDSPAAASEFTDLVTNNESYVQYRGNETRRLTVYELRTSLDPDLRSLAPAMEYVQEKWGERKEADRIKETRGVIVDWAILSGAWGSTEEASREAQVLPAATICGLPSNICKLVPIGLGWNRTFAIEVVDPGPDQRWIEIDNGGSIVPIWDAFEIFSNI